MGFGLRAKSENVGSGRFSDASLDGLCRRGCHLLSDCGEFLSPSGEGFELGELALQQMAPNSTTTDRPDACTFGCIVLRSSVCLCPSTLEGHWAEFGDATSGGGGDRAGGDSYDPDEQVTDEPDAAVSSPASLDRAES